MAEFTKEELFDIINIQQKTAGQLEVIVVSLASIIDRQKEILGSLHKITDNVPKDIVASVEKNCLDCRKNLGCLMKDVMWIKILLSLVGLTVVIVTVILKVTGH